jgi:hypothetical protein
MGARDLLATCVRDALISECGLFRYWLLRRWGDGPLLLFVMLNPSTADAKLDDATIRRCATFAFVHGFAGFYVVNLYAYRATKPADLKRAGYLVGPENDAHFQRLMKQCQDVCVGWGANAAGLERPRVVLKMLRDAGIKPKALAVTRGGHPQHPLMLHSDARLQEFEGDLF